MRLPRRFREGWVGEDDIERHARIVALAARQWRREGVPVADARLFKPMEVQIHDGDLHHVRIIVVAGERVFFDEGKLFGAQFGAVDTALGQVSWFCVLTQDVGVRGDEKASGAAGGVADALTGLWVHHGHDHVDDVARGAELPVGALLAEATQQVLVHVALEIHSVVRNEVHLVDALDDGTEGGAVVDLEGGAGEEEAAGFGEAGQFME